MLKAAKRFIDSGGWIEVDEEVHPAPGMEPFYKVMGLVYEVPDEEPVEEPESEEYFEEEESEEELEELEELEEESEPAPKPKVSKVAVASRQRSKK